MNHVVSLSSGLSSAVMSEIVLRRHHDAHVVFMDTLAEDEDNYRFLDEWLEYFEPRNFVRLCDGRTPHQVWEDKKILPNQKIAPCTMELKIKPFRNWLDGLSGQTTVYIGFDAEEIHRCIDCTASYNAAGYDVVYPLIDWEIPTKAYSDTCREDWGIEPPRMYRWGYTHANCGGKKGGCCKQGQGDWLRRLKHTPAAFSESEAWENDARNRHGDYAFLRDQTGGTVTALPLSELRQRFNHGQISNAVLKKLDFQSPCVSCGVGAAQLCMFGEEL